MNEAGSLNHVDCFRLISMQKCNRHVELAENPVARDDSRKQKMNSGYLDGQTKCFDVVDPGAFQYH